MQAKIAQPWEIDMYWTLDEVFDTLDRMAEYSDVATHLRPSPKAQPRRPGSFGP